MILWPMTTLFLDFWYPRQNSTQRRTSNEYETNTTTAFEIVMTVRESMVEFTLATRNSFLDSLSVQLWQRLRATSNGLMRYSICACIKKVHCRGVFCYKKGAVEVMFIHTSISGHYPVQLSFQFVWDFVLITGAERATFVGNVLAFLCKLTLILTVINKKENITYENNCGLILT